MEGLDLKNSKIDRIIYFFRSETWTFISLFISAFLSLFLSVAAVGDDYGDRHAMGTLFIAAFIWVGLVQLPEIVLKVYKKLAT